MGIRTYSRLSTHVENKKNCQKKSWPCNILRNPSYFYTKTLVLVTSINIAMKLYSTTRLQVISTCLVGAGVLIAAFGLISWAGSSGKGTYQIVQNDTIPSKEKPKYEKDFDKELRQLEEARRQLEKLKSKDWDKVQHDLETAMKNIDIEKVRIDAEKAVSTVDMEKIAKEIEASLKKIDFEKIERDVDAAMNNISKIDTEKVKEEMKKMRTEIEEQLKKQDWRKEMEEIKNIDMNAIKAELGEAKKEIAKVKEELKAEKIDMKATMEMANTEIEKAQQDLKGYQEMTDAMEKEGLLDTKKDYTIQYKDGELTINGRKQSSETAARYKRYFRKDPLTIKKENGNINIDTD